MAKAVIEVRKFGLIKKLKGEVFIGVEAREEGSDAVFDFSLVSKPASILLLDSIYSIPSPSIDDGGIEESSI